MNEQHNSMATLLGGVEIEVEETQLENCFTANRHKVKIRQLPIKDFPAYMAVQDDELKMAVLLTGLPLDTVEKLSINSLERLITEGEKLNEDFFLRWVKRRMDRQEKIMPGINAGLSKAVGSLLLNGSQTAPSK